MNKIALITLVGLLAFISMYQMSQNLLSTPYVPTRTEFEECDRYLKCQDLKCEQSDRECNKDASKFSSCYQSNKKCIAWDAEYEQMSADEKLTSNFYDCYHACGMRKHLTNPNFWEIYDCTATCGSVPKLDI